MDDVATHLGPRSDGAGRDPVVVSDAADPRLRDFTQLSDPALRRVREPAEGLFVAEGAAAIARAAECGYRIRAVLCSPRWLPTVTGPAGEAEVFVAPDEVVSQVAGFRVHRGALASVERRPEVSVADLARDSRRLVITEATVDPTNIGAIARSAAGLGFDGLVLSPTCADPLYRRSVKVSMGEVLRLPTARARTWPDPVRDLVDAGWRVLALTPAAGATDLRDVRLADDDRVALLLGTEGEGLSAGAMSAATQRVSIPMRAGVDSLNVAVAAGIACWALAPRNAKEAVAAR